MESLFDGIISQSAQNRSVQYQLIQMLRILYGEAAGGHCTPAPAQNIDLVEACLRDDQLYGGVDVLAGIVGVRGESILHSSGAAISRHIHTPYGIAGAGE